MGVTHVTVALKGFGSSNGTYEADFLVDTSAIDSLAPAAELRKIGVQPVGTRIYELADGTIRERDYRLDTVIQKQYSAIEHLAYSVFLNHNPEVRLMAMFTVYFDESGTHTESEAVSVGGYLSTVDQWERFQNSWDEILKEAGIEFFHMTDHQNRQGPYKNWSEFKHRRVLEKLIIEIRSRTRVPIGASVPVADFAEYQKVCEASQECSAYTFCAVQCLSQVGEWADQYGHDEPIAYVLESGAGFNKQLDKLRDELGGNEVRKKRYRFGSLTIADKRQMNPLQAADILAYELNKEMVNFIIPGKGVRRPRYSAITLLEGQPKEYCGHYTKADLLSPTNYLPKKES